MLHNGINTINTYNFAKVMFLHLFVSHSASVHAGIHTPLGRHLPRADTPREQIAHPPGADSPWEQTPLLLGADTPMGADTTPGSRHTLWEQTPPAADAPPHSACWEIRATSGWYASYWNAYLLKSVAFFCISAYLQCTECTT